MQRITPALRPVDFAMFRPGRYNVSVVVPAPTTPGVAGSAGALDPFSAKRVFMGIRNEDETLTEPLVASLATLPEVSLAGTLERHPKDSEITLKLGVRKRSPIYAVDVAIKAIGQVCLELDRLVADLRVAAPLAGPPA